MTLSCLVKYQRMSRYEDVEKLQKHLSTLNEWSTEWSMLLNAEKCKCIHYGFHNKQYCMTILWEMNASNQHKERDLGVIITETLDVTK